MIFTGRSTAKFSTETPLPQTGIQSTSVFIYFSFTICKTVCVTADCNSNNRQIT